MGKETGIIWTDATHNPWHGCTKVEGARACLHCYAEGVNKRSGGTNWGRGAPRRRISETTRNDPIRWNRAHDKFFAEHGRRRRVFTLSMGDLFDNEVPDEWRNEHFEIMAQTPNLDWQICTKRGAQIPKMVPDAWKVTWPRHIGVLVTVVNQVEANRDIPRLLSMACMYGMPWAGVSWEPACAPIDFAHFIGERGRHTYGKALDWVIFGGKSGANWSDQEFDAEWARPVIKQCAENDCAFLFKQVAGFRPTDDMIPADLMVRQWPTWER